MNHNSELKGMTMKKNIALATILAVSLGISAPAVASPRDPGYGNPITRIVKLIKRFLAPITHDDPLTAKPEIPHP
jgi:hypothetical protein